MSTDPKRALLRHILATIAFRGGVAMSGAPDGFADFKLRDGIRTPGEILAHIGDLLAGSLILMRGEFKYLNSTRLPWGEEVARFNAAVIAFDEFLAGDAELAQPPSQMVEKLTQGPMADALTHIGQLIMLRRAYGAPTESTNYFEAEIGNS
jgi:hypothetical protein